MQETISRPIWKLKSCPRCINGDLFKEDGHYECLQCGFETETSYPLPLTQSKWHGKPKEAIGELVT